MSVFVDTGVLFAAASKNDARHRRAARILREVEGEPSFTTDHCLLEAWHIARSRASWHCAHRLWSAVRASPLRIEAITLADIERAYALADAWADCEFDFTDCTSFAAMERLGCTRAATFDRDFAVFRYGSDRRAAFEILR